MKYSPLLLLSLCLLTACATGIPLEKYEIDKATPQAFDLCHGYSCTYKTPTGFTDAEWADIRSVFTRNAAANDEDERAKIAKAIALMESYSGAKTGTDEDAGEAVSLKTSTLQMDCIDETVNTTQYLTFIQNAGLLKYHEVAEPTHRGYFIDGRWPHNSAVIRNLNSKSLYVVDAFYRKNGEEPYIVPRDLWLGGWSPNKSL